MKIRIPYLEKRVRRDKRGRIIWQSWYWVPSKRLRGMGWKVMALGRDQADAEQMAIRQNQDVLTSRPPSSGTVGAAIRAYREDDEYPKRPATRASYEQNLAFIEKWAGDKLLAAVTPRAIKDLKKSLAATPYRANAIIGMVRILYSFAIRDGLFQGFNPASRFKRLTVRPRSQVWEPEDEARFAEAALSVGRPSLWIATALALYTAQRQTDVLAMRWEQFVDGHRLLVRQSKTQELVSIPVLTPLSRLLSVTERVSDYVVVNEATHKPYAFDTFRHEVGEIITNIGRKGELQFRDLRRTSVVRMFAAGLSVEEIAEVSGHRIESCRQIIETYLPRGRRLTAASIEKLEDYYKGEAG